MKSLSCSSAFLSCSGAFVFLAFLALMVDAEPNTLCVGIREKVTRVLSTTTNDIVNSYTNGGMRARKVTWFEEAYVASGTYTTQFVVVKGALTAAWFSHTNSAVVRSYAVPPTTMWILPGDVLVTSNKNVTANTNTTKILWEEVEL